MATTNFNKSYNNAVQKKKIANSKAKDTAIKVAKDVVSKVPLGVVGEAVANKFKEQKAKKLSKTTNVKKINNVNAKDYISNGGGSVRQRQSATASTKSPSKVSNGW